MAKMTEKEWTVLFLVQATNSKDIENFTFLLREIEDINFEPHINVIFLINFNREHLGSLMNLDSRLALTEAVEKNYTTMFFKLVRSNLKKNHLHFIQEEKDFDITNPTHISNLLEDEYVSSFVANKYLLFTWDHGDGYGIFDKRVNGQNTTLTMKDLKQALGDRQIDLMIMMNCFMQLIDTGYALRDQVEYLVAPQNELKFRVYDYKRIFQVLAQSPCISAKRLAQSVINSIREKELCKENTVSICALDLSQVHPFVDQLDKLANHFVKIIFADASMSIVNTEVLEAIKEQFLSSYLVRGIQRFIDLYSLLNVMKKQPIDSEINGICDKLLAHFELMQIDFFSNLEPKARNEFDQAYGISIVSPFNIPSEPIFDVLAFRFVELLPPEDIKKTELKDGTDWGKLMLKIDVELDN